MIQEIRAMTSIGWLLFMTAAILASIALPTYLYIVNKKSLNHERVRWSQVLSSIDAIFECNILNLKSVKSAFEKHAPETIDQIFAIESDCKSIYRGLWIPSPETRFSYPEIFSKKVQSGIRSTTASTVALTGAALTLLSFIVAFLKSFSLQLDQAVSLIALMPLLLSLFGFLILYNQRNHFESVFAKLYRDLLLAIERKVPVYTQAGETAIILNKFTDHDKIMCDSVNQLANRVEKLASGELTEAVANALKFVLSATIGPSLQKSTDSLSLLSVALEKQMRSSMNTLGDRLAALEFEQKESSKFLKNQYETVTSTLLKQQEMSFTQLRKVQELLLDQISDQQKQTLTMLTDNQQRVLSTLSNGQTLTYKTLSAEQQDSLQKMTSGYQSAVTSLLTLSETSQKQLTDQYGNAWTTVQSGLDQALSSLKESQQLLFASVQTKQDDLTKSLQGQQEILATGLQTRHEDLSKNLQTEISQVTSAMTVQLTALSSSLLTQQDKLSTVLTANQNELTIATKSLTQEVTTSLQAQLEKVSNGLLTQQEQLVSTLTNSQSELVASTTSLTQTVSSSLISQQEQLSTSLQTHQVELASSLQTRQIELASSLQSRQDALTDTLQSRYDDLTRAIQTQQVDLAAAMQVRQDEVMNAFQAKQMDLVMSLKNSQEALYAATNALQEKLSSTFHSQQLAAIAQMQTAQDATLQKVADYQQVSLTTLTDDVAKNLGTYLDKYLEPVSARLIASADVLVAAQAYADKVQDAFEMQREQVAIVEAGMKDAIQSFVETRTTMMSDLSELRKSTSVMSSSADKMSAIFAGSESGLSDSITLLSGNMSTLGNDLERITSGTAKTTKDLQEQIEKSHSLNQQQIADLTTQINSFSDELATRIEQLTLGFTQVTEDLVKSVRSAINDQNDTLTGNVRHLVEVMSEESRSMSLFAQQINMDIDSLSTTLSSSVAGFNADIRSELAGVLNTFDQDIANVLKRLSVATNELGDAVEALPAALAPLKKHE